MSQVPAGVEQWSDPALHGGALDRATAIFGRPASGWLDLSTGINPWPYPVPALAADAWTRLPTDLELGTLRAAAAAFYRMPDPGGLVAGPGSQALIQRLPALVPAGRRVAVVGPTYGEHARCWIAAGHGVNQVDALPGGADPWDVVVVVNPNNPDGRVVDPDRLLWLGDRLARSGGLLVVDEAFAEVAPDLSVAPWAGRPGLAILRSFGKFFGLAGVRLGFAALPPPLAIGLNQALGPWAVSGPALAVARPAFEDQAWASATRDRLATAARSLDDLLVRCGMAMIGGTSLFRLAIDPAAADRYRACGRAGILLRRFPAAPHWLRFGLPPDSASMARLERSLAQASNHL